jgi:uncharacterized protein
MFLRFRITNHASIRDEQELSLIALDQHDDLATTDVPGTGQQVLPAVAIYGANASGKSNVIDALAFMRRVVVQSHQRWLPDDPIPRRPFRLDVESHAKPSVFVADFAADGVRYEYGFGLTDSAVEEEWLYAWPEHRRRVLFERAADGQIKYGASFPNRRDHPVGKPRSNSLLLSAAAANEHPLLLPLYRLFRSGLYPALNHTFDARLSLTMSELTGGSTAAALALIRFADLGVEEIRITAPASEYAAKTFSQLQKLPPLDLTGGRAEALAILTDALAKIGPLVVEDTAGLDPTSPHELSRRLEFVHRSAPEAPRSATLSLTEESSGTRTWLGLIGPVLKALRDGTVLVVDELDAHLHPHLAARLIGLFQARDTNPHGAQLIFNTHDVSLMGRSAAFRLHRDQIYFAEKGDGDGATRLYPLTDFARVRDNWDNLERWYLSSRLGAVPVFRDALLKELAEAVAG